MKRILTYSPLLLAFVLAACAQPLCLAEEDEAGGDGAATGCLNGDFGTSPPAGLPADAACSSGAWWQGGNEESPLMHPGGNCIDCHTREGEGPRFVIAGTVMGGLDDADDCQGVSDVTVRITGADGVTFDLQANAAGNFSLRDTVAVPYTAAVVRADEERPMATPQTEGNCMACHSAAGAGGAPGRIVAP